MASAIVEFNKQSDSSLVSKSTRLHAAIDEKNKETVRKCHHFSIRGYVSEVRKKDPKLCYPFTLKDCTDPRNELPPMVVPNFRWWQCISCVPEAKNKLLKDSCKAGNGDYQNDLRADPFVPLVGQASKFDNMAKVRNNEASTSIDSNDNKSCSPLSAEQKGKGRAHVDDAIPISSGCENGFPKVSSCQRILQQSFGQVEVDPSTDNEVKLGSRFNQNGTTKALHKDSNTARPEIGSKDYANHDLDSITKNDPPTNGVAGNVSGPRTHNQSLVSLPDLKECNGGPSNEAFNEAKVTLNNCNNNFCEDDDDYLGAERRKKPKVRLLSELLGLKKTRNPGRGKKKTLSSANSQSEFIQRKRLNSQDEYIKRKSVDSQDDGLKPMEIKKSVGSDSQNDCLKRKNVDPPDDGMRSMDVKKSVETSDISETEYGSDCDDVSTEKMSKTKRGCKSKDPLLEKKHKKIKVDHGDSSSLFRQKVQPKSSHGKGNASKELPQNLDFNQLSEKSSVFTKKRGSVSKAQKAPTSFFPPKLRTPKECETTQKDGDPDPKSTEIVQKVSENGHFFLSGYLYKENDQLCLPRKDGLCLSSSQTEHMVVAGNNVQKEKENRTTRETSITLRPTTSDALLSGDQFNVERNNCVPAKSSEKKRGTPEADGCSPFIQHIPMQKSNSITYQKELTNEVRGRIQDIDINSIPTDDNTNEQGPGDDIPMDIVELMAKNQYERHLDDPKDKHVISQSVDPTPTSARQNGNGPYPQDTQNSAQSHFLSLKKPRLMDPRSPIWNKNLGQYTFYNNNHIGVRGLPRETVLPSRFLSPNQARDLNRPYSARGLTPNNWNQNTNAAIGQKYPPTFLQAVDSYQKHRGMAPRPQSITDHHRQHVWQSGLTSRMPLGITNPQKISQSFDALSKGRNYHQSSGSVLNFNPLEKQQNLNFFNAESSTKSSDVNEAIPAMHLLSLMQNAAKMQNTDLSLGPQKVAVDPTSSRYPFSKNDSRSSIQENSCHPCYPTALPNLRPFPMAYKNDIVNTGRTSAGFAGHIPLTLQGQRKMESSHFGPPGRDQRPLRRPLGPPRGKGKVAAFMSKPALFSNPVQAMKDSSNLQPGSGIRLEKTIVPVPDKVICKLNQNPSEFNDLKLVAKYMIGPENLKAMKKGRDRAPQPTGISKRQNIKVNKPVPPSATAVKS